MQIRQLADELQSLKQSVIKVHLTGLVLRDLSGPQLLSDYAMLKWRTLQVLLAMLLKINVA